MNSFTANQMDNIQYAGRSAEMAVTVHYLPVLLDLGGKRCLVVGEGEAARQKANELAGVGAVVSCRGSSRLPGELAGNFLCIAVGLTRARNATIFEQACQSGVLFYAVDDPEHSHFIMPAIHRQGGLVIAVSTSGACPALAVRIRDRLAAEFGPEYAQFVAACARIRARLAELIPDFETRRAAWYALVDSELLDRLRSGLPVTAADFLEEACKSVGIALVS